MKTIKYENSRKLYFGPFLPILKHTRIFMEYSLLSLLFLVFYHRAKFQKKKTNEQIPRKTG